MYVVILRSFKIKFIVTVLFISNILNRFQGTKNKENYNNPFIF